jgi:hypothetical protein
LIGAALDYEVAVASKLPPGVGNTSAHQILVGDIAAIVGSRRMRWKP